jgi:hypothetical protein
MGAPSVSFRILAADAIPIIREFPVIGTPTVRAKRISRWQVGLLSVRTDQLDAMNVVLVIAATILHITTEKIAHFV